MNFRNFLVIFAFVGAAHGCWFSSKEKAVQKMEEYVAKIDLDIHAGIDKADLRHGIASMPKTTAWMLRTFTNVDDIFNRCDTNKDGRLTMAEIRAAPNCVASCVKQMAIIKFL
jgi:hypothetical protein